jgi:hypothetical protein
MASGLPILFSGDGEGASIVIKHNVGLVSPPGDMDALKRNIIEFVRQPEKRDVFSRNCVEAAKNVFDRRLIIDRFDNVLRELAGGRERSEVGNQGSEVGGRRSEVGGRRSEVGGQKSEVGGQRSDVGGRNSEQSQ